MDWEELMLEEIDGLKRWLERRENDGFKYVTLGKLVIHETRREIIKIDIPPPQKWHNERKSWWTLREGIKSLMNHHVEPPWRTPATKEWSNERKEKLKTQGESLQWLDGSSWRYNWENLEFRERKMNKWNQEFWWTSVIRN